MAGIPLRKRLALNISKKLQDSVIADHPLRQLFWECTLRCNLACRHCGSDCRVQAAQQDMPMEDFCRVLDRISTAYDPHGVMVIVTGGEPLMRADLERCGRAFYDREFPWGMVSNGMALTERRYEALLASGLHAMTISLDGLEADHDWMRGRQGSFKRASEAIGMVARSGEIAFDVVTCVGRRNLGSLGEIKEHLIRLGVPAWRLFTIFPAGRAASDPDLQLDGAGLRTLMAFIRDTRREGRIHCEYGCEGFLGPWEGEVRDRFFLCNAGVTVAGILADGAISACPSIRADYHQGNIYRDDFLEVWQRGYLPYRDRRWMKTGVCADCRYFRWCRGNGMHLRDADGRLLACRLREMEQG